MDNIFSYIFNILMTLLAKFINIITTPVVIILNKYIPDTSYLITTAKDFLSSFVFPSVRFGKMLIVNIFNINHTIFDFALTSLVVMIYIKFALLGVRLVYNAWRIFQGSQDG